MTMPISGTGRSRWAAGLSVLILVAATTVFVVQGHFASADPNDPAEVTEPVEATLKAPETDGSFETARALSSAFAAVADQIKPSVVNISSVRRVSGPVASGPTLDPFREFFGDDFFERFNLIPPEGRGRDFVQRGQGSGVILKKDYILTNNHVVKDADEVTVRLTDDRTFVAEVVGTDPQTDLAVLRIDADDVVPARMGDSDALQAGEWVVAAGNPFGLSSSMTAGIVSATGRANVGIADYEDFIQTDAAINPGNSGGPLVNLHGEVVGINTAIFTRSGGYMGIGFAIPINMARSIMASLIDEGRVTRGWLGITIQNLDPGLARSFDFDGEGGVLISDVTPGSPADEAGLESGDIIVGFEGQEVVAMQRFRSQVAATRPGTEVEITVFRDGERRARKVRLGELEGSVAHASPSSAQPFDLGMSVRTLTPDLARRLGQPEVLEGVVITEVDPLGAAARAGLRANEIVLEIQGEPVTTVEDFRDAIADLDLDHGVRLTVQSGSARRFVFLQGEAS